MNIVEDINIGVNILQKQLYPYISAQKLQCHGLFSPP